MLDKDAHAPPTSDGSPPPAADRPRSEYGEGPSRNGQAWPPVGGGKPQPEKSGDGSDQKGINYVGGDGGSPYDRTTRDERPPLPSPRSFGSGSLELEASPPKMLDGSGNPLLKTSQDRPRDSA